MPFAGEAGPGSRASGFPVSVWTLLMWVKPSGCLLGGLPVGETGHSTCDP